MSDCWQSIVGSRLLATLSALSRASPSHSITMAEGFCARFPVRVILVWLALVAICYNLFSIHDPDTAQIMYIPPSHLVDAVVFVAMGTMASDPMVDYSIASVRKLGKWNGDIYVITDIPSCFDDAVQDYEIKTIQVPPMKSIIEIKSLKPRLMSFMPAHVAGVLYIDVDILVTKNLASFFRDLGTMVYTKQLEINRQNEGKKAPKKITAVPVSGEEVVKKNSAVTLEIEPPFDFAAFLDAKGHYVGFCSGCEKWHSGVVWLRRGKGEACLQKWGELLLSGQFDTDQESLDAAEKAGACPDLYSFPTRHLLFAKDYIAMVFTSGQTFVHLTAAGRPEDTDYFYREIMVPHIRNSLSPPLNPSKLHRRKVCKAATPAETLAAAATGAVSGPVSGANVAAGAEVKATPAVVSEAAAAAPVVTPAVPAAAPATPAAN